MCMDHNYDDVIWLKCKYSIAVAIVQTLEGQSIHSFVVVPWATNVFCECLDASHRTARIRKFLMKQQSFSVNNYNYTHEAITPQKFWPSNVLYYNNYGTHVHVYKITLLLTVICACDKQNCRNQLCYVPYVRSYMLFIGWHARFYYGSG